MYVFNTVPFVTIHCQILGRWVILWPFLGDWGYEKIWSHICKFHIRKQHPVQQHSGLQRPAQQQKIRDQGLRQHPAEQLKLRQLKIREQGASETLPKLL